MSDFIEPQNQIVDLVKRIRREEEILSNIKEEEYEEWKYGDRDIYDKRKGQQKIDDQKRYINLLKNELFEIIQN